MKVPSVRAALQKQALQPMVLRDIIDLEATYAGPDAKAMPAPVIGPDGQPIVAPPGAPPVPGSPVLAQTAAPPAAPAGATPFRGAPERGHVGNGGEQAEAGDAAS